MRHYHQRWHRFDVWSTYVRRYWGAHLHRRIFWWFGATIFMTAVSVGLLGRVFMAHAGRRPPLFLLVGVPALVVWSASGRIARRIARPLGDLMRVAEAIGGGDLKARVSLEGVRIGELAVLAQAINDMAARIERQLADQRELLAAVSHELRTPLARLRVLVELVRGGHTDGKTLDDVEREVQEIDALVGQLLASARLDFQALSPRPLDAADVARRALERAGLPAERLSIEPGDAAFAGDPTLLARALANLLDNAGRHGGGVERLVVRTRPGFVDFDVEDRGRADEAPRTQHEGSLGLGLQLVDRIAKAHGGSFTLGARPGGGARATLEVATRRADPVR